MNVHPNSLSQQAIIQSVCVQNPALQPYAGLTRFPCPRGKISVIGSIGEVIGQRASHHSHWQITYRTDAKTQEYVARRIGEGHSKLEAIRCLKRHIIRELYPLILTKLKYIP